MGVGFKKYAKLKKKIGDFYLKKVGNLPNLIISSQDGQVARCDLSFLGASDVWNQASQSHDIPPILPFQICGSTGGPSMALALPWGTVSPGEGGERCWLVAALWKSRLRLLPGWTLQQPDGIQRSPDPAHPWLGPYRTTNKLKLCHISNFLLALLYLLNLLKQCTDCCVWFSNFYQAVHNGIKVSNCVHNMIYTKDLRCAIRRLI